MSVCVRRDCRLKRYEAYNARSHNNNINISQVTSPSPYHSYHTRLGKFLKISIIAAAADSGPPLPSSLHLPPSR